MAIVKGVPDIVIYAGGAFAIYYFFIREAETFKEPILGHIRARTERERMLKARKSGVAAYTGSWS